MSRTSPVAEEKFCLAYMELGEAKAAYARHHPNAGPKTCEASGSAMMARPSVKARIAELKAAAAEKLNVTVADIAKQLDEDRELARDLKQPAAAVSASVAKGKLFGHFVEKKDITIGMRPDDARQVVAALLAKFADKVK